MGVIIVLHARIKNKRDTSSNFELNNPVLLNGEIVIVDDSSKGIRVKVGDGVNAYNDLPFFLDDVLFELKSQINFVSGMIMFWSGSANNIPDGWALCDGANGTPDLTDRFVIGVGKTYNVGDIGGEEAHTLTIDEMPSHNHENQYPAVPPSSGGGSEGYAWYTDSYDWGTQRDGLVGGGQAHNNMPPYYALCYIMKI